jgi:hypothetical protein
MRGAMMITAAMTLLGACAEAPADVAGGTLLPAEARDLEPGAPLPKRGPAGAHLGALKTRDHILRIRAGADGPTYVVTTHDGEVIDEGLDAQALAQRHPELSAALKRGTASGGAVLDATLDMPSGQGPVPSGRP